MTIKMFLLAVLGSNIFWIGVAIIFLIGSAMLMRRATPVTYTWLTKGEEEATKLGKLDGQESFDKHVSMILTVFTILFWWLIVFIWLFCQFGVHAWAFFGVMLRGIFTVVDKITPDVTIKVNKKS